MKFAAVELYCHSDYYYNWNNFRVKDTVLSFLITNLKWLSLFYWALLFISILSIAFVSIPWQNCLCSICLISCESLLHAVTTEQTFCRSTHTESREAVGVCFLPALWGPPVAWIRWLLLLLRGKNNWWLRLTPRSERSGCSLCVLNLVSNICWAVLCTLWKCTLSSWNAHHFVRAKVDLLQNSNQKNPGFKTRMNSYRFLLP